MAFQFLSFIRENRAGALLSGAAALCTYGAWMTRQDITVDTEIMMADPDAMMNSWLGINRFGLVFTKHLFGQAAFHPVISRVLTVILLWITAMVLSFFVHKWSGGQKRFRLFSAVFPVVYVTAPCFAEQLYFVLQSAEVVFAMLLCVLAAYGAGQFAFFGGKWFWAAGSILLLVWAFGTYQAMAAVAASLIVILFMTVYLGENGKEQDRQRFGWLLAGVKLAAVFVIGFVLYMAAAAAVRTLSGGSEAYVADMMHWKKDGFNVCVHWIAGELRRVFDCYYVMFRPEFGWAVLLIFYLIPGVDEVQKKAGKAMVSGGGMRLFAVSVFNDPCGRVLPAYPCPPGISPGIRLCSLLPDGFSLAGGRKRSGSVEKRSRICGSSSVPSYFVEPGEGHSRIV